MAITFVKITMNKIVTSFYPVNSFRQVVVKTLQLKADLTSISPTFSCLNFNTCAAVLLIGGMAFNLLVVFVLHYIALLSKLNVKQLVTQ